MNGPRMRSDAIDEALREGFEAAWRKGRPEPIERFLPDEGDSRFLPTLEELVRLDLELAWESWSASRPAGSANPNRETLVRPPQLEGYLGRFPQLNRPEIVLRLVQQERSVRKAHGEDVSLDEYRLRFPALEISDPPPRSERPMLGEPDRDTRRSEGVATGQSAGPPPTGMPLLSEPGEDTRKAEASATRQSAGDTMSVPSLEQFGNYESLEEIGRGGMGVVYRARQRAADRTVALKVIRRDRLEALPRDTHTSALERFRHEAQAAAKLEHENIVTIYEVGEVDSQPFFSMRYVEGQSLSEILRRGPIGNRQAAGYLEPIARAVHEAHKLGVLHRDLKPQNILVDSKTDRALVADFGLAKLTEGKEELTREGEVMGTPSYMSPEQAKDSARVTATTDVYALGATLYHVLTGRPPFQAANPLETLRQVIDEEAAPPRQLDPSINRDLETICLKCLQKETSRRYDSADALADDLRHYLNGEPIVARPIGTLGRVVRWCRRKPALAASIGATVVAMIVALAATTVGYIETSTALEKESAALEESEESLSSLRNGVEDFYTSVAQNALLHSPGMQDLRKELLGKARGFYDEILKRRPGDPKSRLVLAESHFHVGRISEALDSPEDALKCFEEARDMQTGLLAEEPGKPEYLQALGHTLAAIGTVLQRELKLDDARKAHAEAVEVRTRLVDVAAEDPKCKEYKRTLANSHMNLGLLEKDDRKFQRAREQMNKAQDLRKKIIENADDDPQTRRDLGMGYFNLANLALDETNAPDAEENAEENLDAAITVFEGLLKETPEHLKNQSRLALCYRVRGDLKSYGDTESAIEDYGKAFRLAEELARKNPSVSDYQADSAALHMNMALLEIDRQRPKEALASFRRARDILATLNQEHEDVPVYRRELAVTLREIGSLHLELKQAAEARSNLQNARDELQKLADEFPAEHDYRIQLAEACMAFGRLEQNQDRSAAALDSYQQARKEFETVWKEVPEAYYRGRLAGALRTIGQLQADLGQPDAARTHLEAAKKHLDELLAAFPGDPVFLSESQATAAALDRL